MIKEEIWKPIPNFEGYYEASNTGKIKSVERIVRNGRGYKKITPTILKPSLDEWGYYHVSLSKNGKGYTKRVNRLIAMTFLPNPKNYPQVNHLDGIKENNNVDNLEWCNCSQNMIHCHSHGLSDWGTKIRIVETGEEFKSISDCARAINGHTQLIIACLSGRRKTHKGFHFEVIGDRASNRYKRDNFKKNKQVYKSKINIEYQGETHTLKGWADIYNIQFHTLECRYYKGDRDDRLFREVRKRG